MDILGNMPWGTHLCVFYESKEDLLDILVPYFKAGLENNEFCMWITSEPLTVNDAQEAMRRAIPDFDRFLNIGQIEIIPYDNWYLKDGVFELKRVITAWVDRLNNALAKGYDGMRVTGNTAWLEKKEWQNFKDYEEEINSVIGGYKMMAICTYFLGKCRVSEIMDVMVNHQFAIVRKEGKWSIIESSERKKAEEQLRESEEFSRRIIESSNDCIKVLDLDGNLLSMSRGGQKLMEIDDVTPYLNRSWVDFWKGKDREAALEAISKARKGDAGIFYAYYETAKGTPKWWEIIISPIKDSYGNVGSLLSVSRDITERKKAEESLEQKLKFEETISNISSRFIIISNIDDAINDSLADMGNLSGANRAYLFLFREDDTIMDNTHEWCGEGVGPQINTLKNLPCDKFPWWMNKLRKGETIHIKDVSKLPMEAKAEKEILEQQDIKSLLVLRLTICNKFSGFIGFDNVFKIGEWNEDNLSLLRIFSKIIGDALDHKRQEESLKQSESMLKEQKLALEQKNLALKEMIEHIERTKNKTQEDIAINVDETLMPIVEKLKIKGVSPKYIKLLKYHLKELSSSFGRKITQRSAKLTSREIEICNMIKGGLASKDISELLNVSSQTIEKHRKNIRKKLGLSNKKANLSSYLHNF